MAKDKQINSREDAATKDMTPDREVKQTAYHFPQLGISVQAASYQEAFEEAKKIIRKKEKDNQ